MTLERTITLPWYEEKTGGKRKKGDWGGDRWRWRKKMIRGINYLSPSVLQLKVTDFGMQKSHWIIANIPYGKTISPPPHFIPASGLSSLPPGVHRCLSRRRDKTGARQSPTQMHPPRRQDRQTERCSWAPRSTAGLISRLSSLWCRLVPRGLVGWRQCYFCPQSFGQGGVITPDALFTQAASNQTDLIWTGQSNNQFRLSVWINSGKNK